ncbi:MAG: tetratricopeptide repeat protein, partial [Pseudomonadota bacterium]
LDDKPIAAADRLSRHIEREPLDALAVKLDHMLKFMSGNSAGMRSSMEAVIPAWEEATPDCGYILGCYGFSLEETGDYRNAEIKGRRGVTIAPDDAWGWHAVAHVMEMQGRASEGVVWLKAFDDRLSRLNNFAFHVFWHRALFHLELGQIDQALDLYDNGIRADRTDDFRDIANAASLLMRLEFEKVDVGNRWEELADMSVSHVDDHTLAFADAHYVMALANAERRRAVGDMMTAVSEAGKGDGHGPSMMRAFSGPLMAGIAAFASGDYAGSHEALSMVRARLAAIGGSHAQRDVFEQMLIEAALRSGNRAAAQGLLHERLGRRPTNNWARRRLAAIEGPMHRGEGVTASAIA